MRGKNLGKMRRERGTAKKGESKKGQTTAKKKKEIFQRSRGKEGEKRGERKKEQAGGEDAKEIRGSLRGHLIHSISGTEEGRRIQGAEVG